MLSAALHTPQIHFSSFSPPRQQPTKPHRLLKSNISNQTRWAFPHVYALISSRQYPRTVSFTLSFVTEVAPGNLGPLPALLHFFFFFCLSSCPVPSHDLSSWSTIEMVQSHHRSYFGPHSPSTACSGVGSYTSIWGIRASSYRETDLSRTTELVQIPKSQPTKVSSFDFWT